MPASVMPPWLARLTVRINDFGTVDEWPRMVRRFVALAARWHPLNESAWQRVKYTFLAACVREAQSYALGKPATDICIRVAGLCDGVVNTGLIDEVAFREAMLESFSVSHCLMTSEVGKAAAWATKGEPVMCAHAAARASIWEPQLIWDRLTNVLFNAIEKELDT